MSRSPRRRAARPGWSSSTRPSSTRSSRDSGTSSGRARSASAGISRFLGLAEHLESGWDKPPETDTEWTASDNYKAFVAGSSDGWRDAAIASGEDAEAARGAAERHRRLLHRARLMHAFDVLGDPVRRRILELLADAERVVGRRRRDRSPASSASASPPSRSISKVLRESGFATVRADAQRRLYSVDRCRLREVDQWLDRFRAFWEPKLEALATEIARGKRKRRLENLDRHPGLDPGSTFYRRRVRRRCAGEPGMTRCDLAHDSLEDFASPLRQFGTAPDGHWT